MKKIARDTSFQVLRINANARSASCVCDHAAFVGGRKKFVGAMSVACTACIILEPYFFHVFLKFK